MKKFLAVFLLLLSTLAFTQTHTVESYKIKSGESYTISFSQNEDVEIALIVTNLSVANILDIAIVGAPEDAKAILDGVELDSLNGHFSFLPNRPYLKLKGHGDFKGTEFKIANMSTRKHPATALLKIVKFRKNRL
tara:strand:+ start:527 stop:931 length:405 start_codon:yes stop_codon:yes gene_type:complete